MASTEEDIFNELLGMKEPIPYSINECSHNQKIINIYISQELIEPHLYVELFEKLRLATSTDTIFIYLNTPGGYIDTGVQLIHAMRNCQARIVCVLDGTVCSMGSLIFLAGDDFIVNDYSRLMFHNYSGGTYGKGHEQITNLESTNEWYSTLLTEISTAFLTDEEITNIVTNGHDLWLNAEDVRSRLSDVVKYHESLLLVEQEELEIEQEKEILKRISLREKREKRNNNKATTKKTTKK